MTETKKPQPVRTGEAWLMVVSGVGYGRCSVPAKGHRTKHRLKRSLCTGGQIIPHPRPFYACPCLPFRSVHSPLRNRHA